MRRLSILVVLLFVGACSGKDSPTGPGAITPPATTFALTGNVTGGGTALAGATITIMDSVNGGRATTTDGAGNYSFSNVTTSAFTLQASASGYPSQSKGVNFTTNTSVSFALVKPNPIFVKGGVGDTVFDMPTYVRRIRIQGTYTGYSSNFIVHIAGSHIVNELIGTGWGPTTFDGTYVTTGGVVEILSSSGVSWAFTEVR